MFPGCCALLSAVRRPLCTKKVGTYHCLLLNNKPWRISIFITFDKESRRRPVRKLHTHKETRRQVIKWILLLTEDEKHYNFSKYIISNSTSYGLQSHKSNFELSNTMNYDACSQIDHLIRSLGSVFVQKTSLKDAIWKLS